MKRHQNDISMVTNLTNMGASNPHGGSLSYLTGANVAGTPGKRFHNSDLMRSDCWQATSAADTRFASLTLSANEADGNSNSGHGGGLSLAWDESGNPIPGNRPPHRHVLHAIRQSPRIPRKQLNARLKKRQSILDIVRLDANGIKRTLSKTDNLKLDEYFTGSTSG